MVTREDPPLLRRAVEQARRLAEAVALDEQLASLHDEWARAWLAGRAGEIDQFVEQVRAAYREGRTDARAASAALHGYLAELREGMAKHLERRVPGGAARTVIDAGGEATEEHTTPRSVDLLLLNLTREEGR